MGTWRGNPLHTPSGRECSTLTNGEKRPSTHQWWGVSPHSPRRRTSLSPNNLHQEPIPGATRVSLPSNISTNFKCPYLLCYSSDWNDIRPYGYLLIKRFPTAYRTQKSDSRIKSYSSLNLSWWKPEKEVPSIHQVEGNVLHLSKVINSPLLTSGGDYPLTH